MCTVILQQRRQRFVVGQVVYGHDFEFTGPLHQITKRQTSDATKPLIATRIATVIHTPKNWLLWRTNSPYTLDYLDYT